MALQNTFMATVTVLMWVVVVAFVLGIIAALYFYLKRWFTFKYPVFVLELLPDGTRRLLNDKGGFFIDLKTKNKGFFLRIEKIMLSPDNVPFFMYNAKKAVFVIKTGSKNYRYATISDLRKEMVERTVQVMENNVMVSKKVVEPKYNLNFTVGDEDVNWAVNTFDRNKKLIGETTLMKLMPYFVLAFVGLCVTIIFIYLFKKMDMLVEFVNGLEVVSENLKTICSGTVVVPT